ncbi:MAG: translesion error-prone DNA polymerase V autoproteolytic subunit [Xylophilus ampelinus]
MSSTDETLAQPSAGLELVVLADLPPALVQPLTATPLWVRRIDGAIKAGFPSPADDFDTVEIDLIRELVTHPQATFFVRASGLSMVQAGINDGDMLLVNRALPAAPGHIVVAMVDNEFTVKYLRQRAGRFYLEAANPTFPPIHPRDGQTLRVFGIVTCAITKFVKR